MVVPARNEEGTIALLLDSLLTQTFMPDEVVVVDGGSTDRTVEIAGRYAARGVRVIEIGPAYPGRGRNKGAECARNEWLAFIDAGCVADTRWLEYLLKPLVDDKVQAVFGAFRPRAVTEWEVAQALTLVGPIDPRTGCGAPFIASSLLHRSVWRSVGGFPDNLRAAEDLVFFDRLRAAHAVVARAADAIVVWNVARGPVAAFRRLRLYSAHHVAAGLFSRWHARAFLIDLAGGLCLVLGLLWRPFLAVLLSGLVLRLVKTVHSRRLNVPGRRLLHPVRLFRVLTLILLADAAAWLGALDYVMKRRKLEGAPEAAAIDAPTQVVALAGNPLGVGSDVTRSPLES